MKTNKRFINFVALWLIVLLGISSVSAYWEWQKSGNWTWNNTQSKSNFIDTNNDWIADWEEDWDNDGILNKDDEDFENSNINMRDDDNDWIPNKDDEDYLRTQSQDWTNKPTDAWMWNWNNSSENALLKAKYKNTYENKYGVLIWKMDDEKLNAFIVKIDSLSETFNAWNYSLETKEKFNVMLGALREIAIDNLDIVEDDL
jgi:hypothetical protein